MMFSKPKTPAAYKSSLKTIARSHTLRCDAKQLQRRFVELDEYLASIEFYYLGEYLPGPVIKGSQPTYLETVDPDGVPVISTIAIQNMRIRPEQCRYISQESYAGIDGSKKPEVGDILLTVDGGTSIGKPVKFTSNEQFAIDSHVVILRPKGLDADLLVYLLASPIGQAQFDKAECGASGQTAVTEDDIRRFRFPKMGDTEADTLVKEMNERFEEIEALYQKIEEKDKEMWEIFSTKLSS